MGDKDRILSKFNIKDYKNELELILEEKQFDEEAKSLLLSIFYKLDNFYKDYISVKKDIEAKNVYLENYINIIKTKCKTINMIKPQEVKGNVEYEVDKKKGTIKCVPNELILLYAIYSIAEKEVSDEKYLLTDFTKICVANVLNKGKTINSTELIRDFNGWSWNIQIDNLENIAYNLIFQNILILFGFQHINEVLNKSNVLESLKSIVKKESYGDKGYEFLNELFKTSVILYNNQSEQNHIKCLTYKKSLVNKMNMLNSRKEYVEDKNKDSSNISKQIKKIDEMLNDIKIIRNEYEKRIKQNKAEFFCISDFVEYQENEKKKLLEKIKENNKVLSEKKYLTEHDNYEVTLDLYELIDGKKNTIDFQSVIINLQKSFIECLISKAQRTEQKRDLFNLISQLRYYCNLLYKKDKTIVSNRHLKHDLDRIMKIVINKMIELKIIDTGIKSEKINFEILKYIFKTKIIELETMNLKISFIENNQVEVDYYDSKELEHKEIFDLPSNEEISSKKDIKIKVFKIGG